MFIDGKNQNDPKKVFGREFAKFKKERAANMKKHGNRLGHDGWSDGDGFHLELPDSKMPKTDERVKACLKEYVRLRRDAGKKKNSSFESKYASLLKPYLEAAEKQQKAQEKSSGLP